MATENLAIGSDKKPVYVNKSGKIVPLTGNAGSVTNDNLQPIYLLNGELVALTGTSGAYNKPVRVDNGVIKPITVTAGNGGDRLIYLDNGAVTNSSKTVGDTNKPVYLKNGVVTQISGSIGTALQPVYISNGTITASNVNKGSDTKPLKMVGGVLTPVTKDLATEEYVETAVANNKTYCDFANWNVDTVSAVSTGQTDEFTLTVPRDGFLSLAVYGSLRTKAIYHCAIYVKGKSGWLLVSKCISTDFYDNTYRNVGHGFHGFVKGGTQFLMQQCPFTIEAYLFYP